MKKPTLPDLVRTNGFSLRETGTLWTHSMYITMCICLYMFVYVTMCICVYMPPPYT